MSDEITVPGHLTGCRFCSALYKNLARAYSKERGADFDRSPSPELLCDHCGETSCATGGCECRDVLCPHGRNRLRSERDAAMLELLRAVESAGLDNRENPSCPICNGGPPYQHDERPTHHPGCKLAEILGDAWVSARCGIDGCRELVGHRPTHSRLDELRDQRASLDREIQRLEER